MILFRIYFMRDLDIDATNIYAATKKKAKQRAIDLLGPEVEIVRISRA